MEGDRLHCDFLMCAAQGDSLIQAAEAPPVSEMLLVTIHCMFTEHISPYLDACSHYCGYCIIILFLHVGIWKNRYMHVSIELGIKYSQCHTNTGSSYSGQYYQPPPPVSAAVYEQYRKQQMAVIGPQPLYHSLIQLKHTSLPDHW